MPSLTPSLFSFIPPFVPPSLSPYHPSFLHPSLPPSFPPSFSLFLPSYMPPSLWEGGREGGQLQEGDKKVRWMVRGLKEGEGMDIQLQREGQTKVEGKVAGGGRDEWS